MTNISEQPKQNESRTSRELLQEERYLWMARAFVVMMVLAFICDIILLIALSNVTPVMRVQPFYLETQNKEQQIVSVARPSVEVLDSDVLKKSLVRQYLLARFGVSSDLNELNNRWDVNGPVYWMSESSVYDEFLQKERTPLQKLAQDENFTRDVQILRLNQTHSGGVDGYDGWHAELEFRDKNRASIREELQYWDVDLATAFRPTPAGKTWADRLKNPLGFTVLSFGLKRSKEKSSK